MNLTLSKYLAAFLAVLLAGSALAAPRRLRVGVTMPPYHSWVANVAGKAPVEVVPLLPAGADAHGYQSSPDDLRRVGQLDLVVVNGLGHDDFAKPILDAAGRGKTAVINASDGLALIPYARAPGETATSYNSHTFLSITDAVTQVYAIQKKLGELAPEHAAEFRRNAAGYVKRLRKLKADALARLARLSSRRVATVHDGYAYFLQELGVEVASVIEPSHGVEPSASELAKTIDAIRKARVLVVFSELSFSPKLVAVIRRETGAHVEMLDHMSTGEYRADRFERAMAANLDAAVRALTRGHAQR